MNSTAAASTRNRIERALRPGGNPSRQVPGYTPSTRSRREQPHANVHPSSASCSNASAYASGRRLWCTTSPSQCISNRSRSRRIESAAPAALRGVSRSSMRTNQRPPWRRALSRLPSAATSEPKCSGPVGDGAKRPCVAAAAGIGAGERQVDRFSPSAFRGSRRGPCSRSTGWRSGVPPGAGFRSRFRTPRRIRSRRRPAT